VHKFLIAAASVGTVATLFAGVALLGVDDDPTTKVLGNVIVQQGKPGPPSGAKPGGGETSGGPAEFTVAGGITGLFPGSGRGITLQISNPYAFAIKVTSVTAKVKSSSSPACPVSSLVFDRLVGAPVVVPARSTAGATLPVRMLPEAGNACSGLTFTLSYSAEAVQA
jgi:hypothetical protein